MSAAGWLQLAALVFVVLVTTRLLGAYLARVLEGSVFAGGIYTRPMPGHILAGGGSSLGSRFDDLVLELGGPRLRETPLQKRFVP